MLVYASRPADGETNQKTSKNKKKFLTYRSEYDRIIKLCDERATGSTTSTKKNLKKLEKVLDKEFGVC